MQLRRLTLSRVALTVALIFGAFVASATCLGAQPVAMPSDEQVQAAELAATDYFKAIRQGRYEDAYSLQSPLFNIDLPMTAAIAQWQREAEQQGEPGDVRVMSVTWYFNPENAPAPGAYVALDIERPAAKVAYDCGYVVLYQPPEGGPFRVMRVEHTLMSLTDAKSADAPQVWAQLATAYCPNWRPGAQPLFTLPRRRPPT